MKTRILGIDFGIARIGLALSDENKIIAQPLHVITMEKRLDPTLKKLKDWISSHAKENG